MTQLTRDGYMIFPDLLPWQIPESMKFIIETRNVQSIEQSLSPHWLKLSSLWSEILGLFAPGQPFTPNKRISISIKEPGSPVHKWHRDWFGWGSPRAKEVSPPRIGLFVYLEPTTEQNGCLRVIPGSHLDTKKEANDLTAASVMTVPGDVVVLDGRIIHGTHPNVTDKHRHMVGCWYDIGEPIPPEQMRTYPQ